MHVIVTGGAGYIGSHTCLELLSAGHTVSVIDNLCNASREALNRVEKLTQKTIQFYEVDLCDLDRLRETFGKIEGASAIIHFAGLKAVGESVAEPLRYYQNNLISTLNLCQVMQETGIGNIVFSSSATVYGDPASVPIKEDFPLSCTNPYGRTKLMTEEILQDVHRANPQWNVILLRYFNPVGAHPSGIIGEDPNGIPNNLMPYIAQVAIGKLAQLSVFGNDYPTPDGTGVRDFIHVVDLAKGHLSALNNLKENPGVAIYNLGTGRGYSVLEMVAAFSRACGTSVPYAIVNRRPGDIAQCYADPTKARKELGWQAKFGLEEMCADSWRWQSRNPNGFA